jgi:hypothetical protein
LVRTVGSMIITPNWVSLHPHEAEEVLPTPNLILERGTLAFHLVAEFDPK